MKFIGRNNELFIVQKFLNKTGQQNMLIYGRRKIGKTYLIKKALENFEGIKIHYQCKTSSYDNTLKELNNLITTALKLSYPINFTSIDEQLDFLFKRNEKIVLVLDEYPYLYKTIDGLDSIVQWGIDTNKYDSNLKLILSGSEIDMMKGILEYNNPLYGRFSDVIDLKEQNYLESSLYYPSYTNEEKVMLYAVFGGEPLYNSMIDETKTVTENIIELIIKENSIGEFFINNVLISELSKISQANEVLQVIALGTKKNEEIVSKAHIATSASLNPILKKLLNLDLIKKVTPINDETNKKKTLYYLKSNSLKFYYRYIYRNLNERLNMDLNEFYHTFIKPDFEEKFIPKVFEEIFKQYLQIKNKNNQIIPPFYNIGTYWYDDPKNKKNGQFDIVTKDKKGYIFYEVKYKNQKIDDHVINEEINSLTNLNINYYNLGFISKKGFNVTNQNYIYITLDDLYKLKIENEKN